MIERNHVVLSTPTSKSLLLASRQDIASVELAQDANSTVAVQVTPLPKFDDEQDFLVKVEQNSNGQMQVQVLRGQRPRWTGETHTLLKTAIQCGAAILADCKGPRTKARVDFNFPGPQEVLLEATRLDNLPPWDRQLERFASAVRRALATASGTETIRIGLHEYDGHAIELVRAHLESQWRVKIDPGQAGWPVMVISPK